MAKEPKIVIHADTTNPATWGLYSFESIPNRHDSLPLGRKEKELYAIVMGVSLLFYFGLCFVI